MLFVISILTVSVWQSYNCVYGRGCICICTRKEYCVTIAHIHKCVVNCFVVVDV